MVDVARLGLAVDSAAVEKGTIELRQFTGAAGQASAAARQLAGASQAEAAGQRVATAATVAHNAALMAQNGIIRSSMQQRTMMIYQLNDVVVSLASGMNPAMVAIQQGSQIFQGGFAPALRTISDLTVGLVAKFWPLAAVIGVVAAAIGGLTYEFNKTADVQVNFFDVALAGWQMFAEMIGSILAPVWGGIVAGLQWVWDQIAPIIKGMANSIIGAFSFAVQAIGALWSGLPAAIGDVTIQTANIVIKGIEWSIQRATELINSLINTANDGLGQVGLNIPTLGAPQIAGFDNPFAGAAGQLGSNIGAAGSNAFGTDYLGGLGDAWSKRAQGIAAARQETDALSGATKAANDNVKALDQSSKSLAETWGGTLKSAWSGFWSDFSSGLKEGKSGWEALGGAAMNALDKLTSKALDMAANGIWDLLLGAFGGMGMGSGMPGTSSITGSSGGSFPGFASGTNYAPGGLAWVGERGPELVNLPRGSQVIPNGPSMAMAANQNTTSVVRIELGPDLEGRVLTQAAGQTVQIVQASEPSTVQKSTASAGKALASGDYRRGMASYGLQQQAKRR